MDNSAQYVIGALILFATRKDEKLMLECLDSIIQQAKDAGERAIALSLAEMKSEIRRVRDK